MEKRSEMDAARSQEERGFFGGFGGRFVPEHVEAALEELEAAFYDILEEESFQEEFEGYLEENVGRPSPLYFARNLTEKYGPKIYLKREDLNHMGAHKINNTIGQALLARRMGKEKIIAETGAGQHGVATATVAAMFDLECRIFMGEKDVKRQKLNVHRMKLLGAEVIPVTRGSATLSDAVDAALEFWIDNLDDTYYLLGSAVGPHPYPTMVREFQSVIGRETREQILHKEGRLPDYLLACVGGGSNAIGLFHDFRDDDEVNMIGLEAGGKGEEAGEHAAALSRGESGIGHGFKSYLLQDDSGEISQVHSIAAGLDYPGVGPEHSAMMENGRASYKSVSDEEALKAFRELSEEEGILPALESSHALAYLPRLASELEEEDIIVVNLSGRGDKDVKTVADRLDLCRRQP